jgi:hypothetical protein
MTGGDVRLWPEGEVIDVSREVGFQGETRLIVLKVSFVVRDPERTLANRLVRAFPEGRSVGTAPLMRQATSSALPAFHPTNGGVSTLLARLNLRSRDHLVP